MLTEICMSVTACDTYQIMRINSFKNRPYHLKISVDYASMESLLFDTKFVWKGFTHLKYLLVTTCEIMNLVLAIPIKTRVTQEATKALTHRVLYIFVYQNF